jgi:rhamnosyltransferase
MEKQKVTMKIVVLLSTYNGATYLRGQIDSILAQKNVDVQLLVRDDGSTDSTCAILQEYADRGELTCFAESNVGVVKSFLALCLRAPVADYYAFADQDDVWLPEKLWHAVTALEPYAAQPAACAAQLRMVDEALHPLPDAPSAFPFDVQGAASSRERQLKTLCVWNDTAGYGCTQVWNRALHELLLYGSGRGLEEAEAANGGRLGSHDFLIAFLATLNGKFLYIKQADMLYRQHGHNASGQRTGWKAKFAKWGAHLCTLLKGAKFPISGTNAFVLGVYGAVIAPEAARIMEQTVHYKESWKKTVQLATSDYPKNLYRNERIKFRLKVLLRRY